ncbi:MAG: ATP-binding protein [Thermodesulfobacteriota bacterium]
MTSGPPPSTLPAPASGPDRPAADPTRKRRRLWLVIAGCLALVSLFTFLETRLISLGPVPLPVSGNVLVFTLINLNVILLLLMVFLVLRNLVHLAFERRQRLLGSSLRTKLVISFVSLSLIPTGLLFAVALQFVSTSMDYWFNSRVEESLEESLALSRSLYQEVRQDSLRASQIVAARLAAAGLAADAAGAQQQLAGLAAELGLAGLELVTPAGSIRAGSSALAAAALPELPAPLVRRALAGEAGLSIVQSLPAGDVVRGLTMTPGGLLASAKLIPAQRLRQMEAVSQGLGGYRQLILLKGPLKTSLLVLLLIVTLLIVFSAIWFGFYVARGLTGPIKGLAFATRRVAEGDLDFVLAPESSDEMGVLVESFNRMTQDLKASHRQLAESNQALLAKNIELDNRRRHTEIILQNVAAGVVSFDASGIITSFNRFAEELFRIPAASVVAQPYQAILPAAYRTVLEDLMAELAGSDRPTIQRPLRLAIRRQPHSLVASLTRLEDEAGNRQGHVLVFENLTELEKAQRVAAWREVARRIAHEVKNPLTPIGLSAQRLRKRYLHVLGENAEVFDLCTRTIISQVEELRRLVGEFSSFARLPAVQLAPGRIQDMVRETMALYQEAHREMVFVFEEEDVIPEFSFDRKQLQQVVVNLLDNGVAALAAGGRLKVSLALDRDHKRVILEVADNGPGVPDEDKPRVFEPYFSTKKGGTGLGLAIASSVVAGHGGYMRVRDNPGGGAVFVVDLPLA